MRWDLGFAVLAYVLLAFVSLWIVDRIPGRRAADDRPVSPRGDRPVR